VNYPKNRREGLFVRVSTLERSIGGNENKVDIVYVGDGFSDAVVSLKAKIRFIYVYRILRELGLSDGNYSTDIQEWKNGLR